MCRILRETNADRCPETHEILLGCAQKNDDMNRPDVFVIEVFGVTVFDALVLAKQKVCRVTGSAFAGKAVADFCTSILAMLPFSNSTTISVIKNDGSTVIRVVSFGRTFRTLTFFFLVRAIEAG